MSAKLFVIRIGFKPMTFPPEAGCFIQLCDPDWIQTNDLLLRRQLLYSTELPDQYLRTCFNH